jgi:UDP-N-acetylglucosamine enolpyruvyl transferase
MANPHYIVTSSGVDSDPDTKFFVTCTADGEPVAVFNSHAEALGAAYDNERAHRLRDLRMEAMLALEIYIDAASVDAALDVLADICHAKAQHVRENWQDETSAREWAKLARRVEKIGAHGRAS